ncbi:aspartoacylase [Alginatibacterium sediminis]|uniref:Aspartoacylase n=1 Tax=Alginatibacterium sediminis TaxID=2164068 RepID=A0A420E714_9ALTE|nr:aspartoacylase [Alginatibacterium sediminis]RKF14331.1 aspartoacylase [Alginatibacterium sediminis]
MKAINKVAVVGGTHGNEFTGVYLVKQWRENPELIERSSLDVTTVLANSPAHDANRRYLDSDLNRQFKLDDLNNHELTNYEQSRAKALNQQLGPKENPKTDFIIDLHNTTSNMGPCVLLLQQDPIYNLLAGYLKLHMPEVVIVRDDDHLARADHQLLATTARYGVIIEIGPQPQSVLRHDVIDQMQSITGLILDFLQAYNQQSLPELPQTIDAFRYIDSIKLPLSESGERLGMVHRSVQDQDFTMLNPGDPLFQMFSGETIYYEGEHAVYPAFINEAAYYDNNLAMSMHEAVKIKVYS